MNQHENAAALREDAYRLLAACYYSPTPALKDENCCDVLAGLLSLVAPEAAVHAAEAAEIAVGQSIEKLAVEHARLFIGPFQLVAPPYGSYYLDDKRTVMGDSTAGVEAFYSSCDMHLADDFRELPDHITVELEFLSYLAFSQRRAEAAADADGTRRVAGLQREFLGRYLMPWLEPFSAAVINDGEAPFYQAIARCTQALAKSDYAALTDAAHG